MRHKENKRDGEVFIQINFRLFLSGECEKMKNCMDDDDTAGAAAAMMGSGGSCCWLLGWLVDWMNIDLLVVCFFPLQIIITILR